MWFFGWLARKEHIFDHSVMILGRLWGGMKDDVLLDLHQDFLLPPSSIFNFFFLLQLCTFDSPTQRFNWWVSLSLSEKPSLSLSLDFFLLEIYDRWIFSRWCVGISRVGRRNHKRIYIVFFLLIIPLHIISTILFSHILAIARIIVCFSFFLVIIIACFSFFLVII